MRYNPVMVVEQSQVQQTRGNQQFSSSNHSSSMETTTHFQQAQDIIQQQHQSPHLATVQHQQAKITSSPRPSILRKRDHEGSPLKASKNLTPMLSTMAAAVQHHQQHLPQQTSISPPPRPNSEGNDHSSGVYLIGLFWFS